MNGPTEVLSYDTTSQDFTINTADLNLATQTKNYSIDAEFTTYPKADFASVSTDSEDSTITFNDPCVDDIESFTQAQWPSMGEDSYSGTEV